MQWISNNYLCQNCKSGNKTRSPFQEADALAAPELHITPFRQYMKMPALGRVLFFHEYRNFLCEVLILTVWQPSLTYLIVVLHHTQESASRMIHYMVESRVFANNTLGQSVTGIYAPMWEMRQSCQIYEFINFIGIFQVFTQRQSEDQVATRSSHLWLERKPA